MVAIGDRFRMTMPQVKALRVDEYDAYRRRLKAEIDAHEKQEAERRREARRGRRR